MFDLTETKKIGKFFIVAFRGQRKSTIITIPIRSGQFSANNRKNSCSFSARPNQGQTAYDESQARAGKQLILKNDLGPFHEESDEWGTSSLVFSQLNARITAASSEQSIRGLRHNQHRPDLIICDDVEDMASTKTREGRNKTYQWLTAEVIPAGDRNTRLVIVGNLLHEDSLLMRIKEDVTKRRIDGVFKEFPVIKGQEILWPGKYPTPADIESEKRKAGNEFAWEREYMLHIVSDEEQAIHREWIQFYDELPQGEAGLPRI